MRALPITALAIAIACTACTERDASPDATPPATSPVAPAATIASPAAAMTPAPAVSVPSPATVAPSMTGPMPAEGAITYAGFGPAHWGASEEQVRQAWGKDLQGAPSEPNGCYYLFPEPRSAGGYRLAFLFEGAKFSRLDVRVPDIAAPGGGRIGMGADEINERYAGRVEARKHKYVDGAQYLRVSAPRRGNGVLVFETDAAGTITGWRIGVPPQVDYVEGCA